LLESNRLFDLKVRDADIEDSENRVGQEQSDQNATLDTSIIGISSLNNKQNAKLNVKIENRCDDKTTTAAATTKQVTYEKFVSVNNVKTRKSQKTKLKTNKNLNEMVKDMASFEWNTCQIMNSSNVNKLTKHLSQMTPTGEEAQSTRKQIKFENDQVGGHDGDETSPHQATTHMNKSRSFSSARGCADYVSDLQHNADKNVTSKYKMSASKSRPAIFSSTLASRSSSRSSSARIINILGKEIVKLPVELECEIKIKKKFDPLGIQAVDCLCDEGVNGCIVLRIEPYTACARDNRLKVGDYLVSVNNEQMRNLTNSSAKGILNRASLTSSDVV
jgi:hypothetical protein